MGDYEHEVLIRGRVGDYEHEVLIRSRPRWRFGYFAAAGKVTRRPQAAESPCDIRASPPHPAPSGPPSPQGEGFFGEPPLSAPGERPGKAGGPVCRPYEKSGETLYIKL